MSKQAALCGSIVILTIAACRGFIQPAACTVPRSPKAVLVDASHDGGVWWSPQAGPFDQSQPHQGHALADTLRARGYVVDELPPGYMITSDRLLSHQIVIRAGYFGSYASSELAAYQGFVACPRTLVLLGESVSSRTNEHDDLADSLGIPLTGVVSGSITSFAPHPITAGVTSIPFVTGSFLDGPRSTGVLVLGFLDAGQEPVMGIQQGRPAKLFFIGDTNGIESVPQPFVDNLLAWGF